MLFERDVRAGRAEAARALYRGELLPGFYDEWIDEERMRLAALRDHLALWPASGTPAPLCVPQVENAPAPTARVTLPTYLTALFGAQEQASKLGAMVRAHRLVTLIGPGGAGKSRLAVEMAHAMRAHGEPPAQEKPAFDLIAFVALVACTTRAQACDALTGALQIEPGSDDPCAP